MATGNAHKRLRACALSRSELSAQISLADFVLPTQWVITTGQYGQLLTAPGMGKYYCILTQVHNKREYIMWS